MVPNVIHRMEAAHAQKDGRALIVKNGFVLIMRLAKRASISVNVRRIIQKVAIHGPVNVIAKPAGVVIYVIVRAPS